MRDLILGHTPPATLTDWRYLGAAGLAGVLVFVWYNRIANHGTFIATFDAVGLSVFTVTGTVIALNAVAQGLEDSHSDAKNQPIRAEPSFAPCKEQPNPVHISKP